jgi:hypothetical protein
MKLYTLPQLTDSKFILVLSLTRIFPEHDTLTNKDHAVLDANVLNVHREFNREPNFPTNRTIGDERLATLTPPAATDMLHREPALPNVLRNA